MTISPSTTTSMKALDRFIKKPSTVINVALLNLPKAIDHAMVNYRRPIRMI